MDDFAAETRHIDDQVVTLRKQGDVLVFELQSSDGELPSTMRIHRAFPGLCVAFHDYHSRRCHVFNSMDIAEDIVGVLGAPKSFLEINACIEGSFRILCPQRRVLASLRQGAISLAISQVSKNARVPAGSPEAGWVLDLPVSRYRGIGFIIDLQRFSSQAKSALDALGLDIGALVGLYGLDRTESIVVASAALEDAIASIASEGTVSSAALMRLRALEMLALLESEARCLKDSPEPRYSFETIRLVEEARNFAVSHLEHRYTIDHISRKFGMSPTVFKRAFRELYNEPYARYVNRQRMENARALLSDGMPVLTVAKKIGYENPSKFSKAFKKAFGRLPSTYGR